MTACVCGDARNERTYAASLAGRRAQFLFTDPPYCLLTRRRKGGDLRDARRGVKIDREPVVRFEDVRSYRKFTEEWLPLAAKHVDGVWAVWTNFLGRDPIVAVARGLGRALAGEFVWAKWTSEHEGNERMLRVYETALVFTPEPLRPPAASEPPLVWSAATAYHDPDAAGEPFRAHPNHKPFAALEPLLRQWSKPGDVVLDPFAGSGSIPAAALRLGRVPACSELDPTWSSLASDRLQKSGDTFRISP